MKPKRTTSQVKPATPYSAASSKRLLHSPGAILRSKRRVDYMTGLNVVRLLIRSPH